MIGNQMIVVVPTSESLKSTKEDDPLSERVEVEAIVEAKGIVVGKIMILEAVLVTSFKSMILKIIDQLIVTIKDMITRVDQTLTDKILVVVDLPIKKENLLKIQEDMTEEVMKEGAVLIEINHIEETVKKEKVVTEAVDMVVIEEVIEVAIKVALEITEMIEVIEDLDIEVAEEILEEEVEVMVVVLEAAVVVEVEEICTILKLITE